MLTKSLQTLFAVGLTALSWSVDATACEEAESFVIEYYQNLNNAQVSAALSKWNDLSKKQASSIRKSVRNFQFTRVDEINLVDCSGDEANVYVNILLKKINSPAERWKGNVILIGDDGEWKIDTQELRKTNDTPKSKKEN